MIDLDEYLAALSSESGEDQEERTTTSISGSCSWTMCSARMTTGKSARS